MSDQITITLPDGSTREYASEATPVDVAASIGKRLAKATVAAKVDGDWVDATHPIDSDAKVELVTADSDDGREVLRHSTAHVLAQAVTDLFPGAKYAIGPAIADGFYYDFELPDGAHFSEHDLERITKRMREIIKADQRFVRDEVDYDAGLRRSSPTSPTSARSSRRCAPARPMPTTPAKSVARAGSRLYRNVGAGGAATFVDLCRGPHVPTTGRLGAFKLTKVAGAYWRGDEHRPMLQRIYGTAWESEAALAEHLHRLEEAERRDHRRLGAELDLFSFPEEIGSGLAVFHPKGGMVRKLMEDYSRQRHEAAGYEFVNSPHITKAELFETSGHLEWFADGMFPPMELDGGTKYYLKPMNCPFHILIYRSRTRSYRELPLRLFEFGSVYRYEKSGVVHGLTRAGHDAGRRAHLHDARGDDRGDPVAAALRARSAARLRAHRLLPRAVDEAAGQGRRHRRGVGRGDRGAARRGATDGSRSRARRGRRRVLRTEDLGAGTRRDRAHVAAVDDPARLPDCRSASTCTTSPPTTSGAGRS